MTENSFEQQPIAWQPTPDVIERARITQFMKQIGVSSWEELYEFSIRDVEKFTEEVIKFLDIKFDPPYEKLLDTSNGIAMPTWFGRNADAPVRFEGEARTTSNPFENRKGWHERGYLPHFDGAVTQFVTFRLADSLPQNVLRRLEVEIEEGQFTDPSKEYRKRIEDYLDSGIGECILKKTEIAEIVKETLLNEQEKSCHIFAWVIMPNHVHIQLRPFENNSLSDIIQRVKSVTSHKINKFLGRSGAVWQPDYFDRYIRDEEHFGKTYRYVENNPVKAGLCKSSEQWKFSSASPEEPAIGGTRTPPSAMSAKHEQDFSPEEPAIADEGVRVPSAGLNITEMCLDRWQTDEMKDQPAVIWENEFGDSNELTYLELLEEVEEVAEGLRLLGLTKGDAVGIHLPMIDATIISLLAINRIGAIAVPVFSGYGIDAISSRLNAVKAKALFTTEGFQRRGKHFDSLSIAIEAVANCPSVKKMIVVGRETPKETSWTPDERVTNNSQAIYYHLLIEKAYDEGLDIWEPIKTSAEDPLIVLYTSGTTGKPKGIAHTHASFPIKAAQDMAFGTDVGKGTRICWYTDIGWMMGPWLIYGALINGATICLYDGAPDYPTSDRMWEFCAKHKVEVLGISPTLIRSLAANNSEPTASAGAGNSASISTLENTAGVVSPEEALPLSHTGGSDNSPHERHDLSSLRIFASTGEPWNPDPWWWLFEKVGNSKLPIINYSGGTEIAGGILMGNPLLPIKPCSFPAPCLGMDVDILDEIGNPVTEGKVGELVIKQPWMGMARGFWKEKERYLETYWSRFENIWVHGDWAMRDEDSHWFILGRSDDTLKVAGKRVGPAEVESLLVAHQNVVEAAVIGVPDEVKGTAMVAFVVISEAEAEPTEFAADLKALVAKDMGKPLAPSKIHFVTGLPKTRNAKVMRRVLRSAYLGQDPGDLSALEDSNVVEEISALKDN